MTGTPSGCASRGRSRPCRRTGGKQRQRASGSAPMRLAAGIVTVVAVDQLYEVHSHGSESQEEAEAAAQRP